MQFFRGFVGFAVLVLLLAVSPAVASINYGDFNGTTVDFLQVTEDSTTDPVPLFGPPVLSGDALNFNPIGFGATASNGSFDFIDGTLAMYVDAHANMAISKFSISEAGDYTLAGTGTNATWVRVVAPVIIRVLEINDVGVAPLALNTALTFTPSGGDYFLNTDPGAGVIWTGALSADIDAFLASQAVSGKATKISVQFDNQMIAFSETGTIAFIKKKNVGGVAISVNNDPVPEPSSLALVALAGVALLRRRRD